MTVALAGEFGKPRPALVLQGNLFNGLPSTVLCPLTTTLRQDADLFRIDVKPSDRNGLRQPSQISIDKIATVRNDKIGATIGRRTMP